MDADKWIDCGEGQLNPALLERAETDEFYASFVAEYQGKHLWRYVGPDGAAYTGWKKIDGQWYMFYPPEDIGGDMYDPNSYGYMFCGIYADKDLNIYSFDSEGIYRQNTWYQGFIDNRIGWWYFGSDGKALSGWHKINGKWYYFYPNYWNFMHTKYLEVKTSEPDKDGYYDFVHYAFMKTAR